MVAFYPNDRSVMWLSITLIRLAIYLCARRADWTMRGWTEKAETKRGLNDINIIRTACFWCLVSIPLPFRRSVLPFRCTVAILPFRNYRCRCGWERKCWKRLSVWRDRTLIGCPPAAERQKNSIRSYCYGTAVTAQRQVKTATAQRIFSRKQRSSSALT